MYWPGEESDDQSATGKVNKGKPVPASKAKVAAIHGQYNRYSCLTAVTLSD